MLWTLSVSSAVSVNIVFDIFIADLFKLKSLFFYCLLKISICRNCLIILNSQSADSHRTVISDVLISLLHFVDTSQTCKSESISSVSSDVIDISVSTDELSMSDMRNDYETECFDRVVRFFLHNHLISFHSEKVGMSLWAQYSV